MASDWHRSQSRDVGLRRRLAERWSRRPVEHSEEQRLLALAVADELESMLPAHRQVLVLRYYAWRRSYMSSLTGPEEDQFRLALGMIGVAAEEGGSGSGQGPGRVWRKRPGSIAGALAAAAVVGLVLLAYGLADDGSDGSRQEQGRALTEVEWIACSPKIVEGDIAAIEDHPEQADAVKVTLTVTDWIKPKQGSQRQTQFTTMSGTWKGETAYSTGEHMLVVVMDRPDEPADSFRDDGAGTSRTLASFRSRIDNDLPAAAKTECPAFWRNRDE